MTASTNLVCYIPPKTGALVRAFLDSHLPTGELSEQTGIMLAREDFVPVIEGIGLEDQERLVDKIGQVYTTIDAQNAKFLVLFGNLCSTIKRLPTSAVLSTGLAKRGDIAVASGGLGDAWRGEYRGSQVVIKAFRTYSPQHLEEAEKILWKLVPTWTNLNHSSIAAFRGVNMGIFPLALVHDWAENGNIIRYLKSHPDAPRLALLLHVAEGLQYLHSLNMPHGNLKGTNVLVDESGHALLTDYGLALMNASPMLTMASSTVGNPRWLAPEVIERPPGGAPLVSKAADVFAFGMVAAEVFTGKPPFEGKSDSGAAHQILEGERPDLPQDATHIGLTAQMRELLQMCWHKDPAERPTIDEVVMVLKCFLGHKECVQRTLNKWSYGEFVPDTGSLPGGPQPTPPQTGTGGQPINQNLRGAKEFWRKWFCGLH